MCKPVCSPSSFFTESLRIPDVGKVRCQLDVVDEILTRVAPPGRAKREDRAKHAVAEVFLREVVVRVAL